eukprot:1184094-Prorocentrum_minimum.AAC.1
MPQLRPCMTIAVAKCLDSPSWPSTADRTPVVNAGGMILVKPDRAAYEGILEVVRAGDFRYDGSGWEGSGIGYSYGGETIQSYGGETIQLRWRDHPGERLRSKMPR